MSELEAQRRMTAALVAYDPTEAALIPRVKTVTASGAASYTDGTPRASQRFKLSLLNYDQRPDVTLAGGVVRKADYHLIGPHDMAIEIGDHWTDADGTRYDVTGFTEGWGYMRKAFVVRTLKGEKVVPAL
ncbi:hypothetical protein [Micromonospora sp. NPDC092111]|uniref:hypothetical protein n=1 Tax=Micromonospora sp. NPDC092111 TaxID=3364289 RepID=UPI00382A4E4D